jgi:L-ascorbate metabolism protein UlaG (beta-lactamase superfamily)
MEITWHGESCFRLTERGLITVVSDPYAEDSGKKVAEMPKIRADVITLTRKENVNNNVAGVSGTQRGEPRVISGAGEYELGGVFITGVTMKPEKKKTADSETKPIGGHKCTVYSFNYDGLNVAHLGALSFVPTQQQIDALETVHVLMVPIGGGESLTPSQAAEVVSLIEPNVVIPMQYHPNTDTLGKFLKEMGLSECKAQETLKVTNSGLPEGTQVVVLEPKF